MPFLITENQMILAIPFYFLLRTNLNSSRVKPSKWKADITWRIQRHLILKLCFKYEESRGRFNDEKKSKFHYAWVILIAISIIVGIGKGAINNSAGLFLPSVTDDLGIGMGKLTLYFSVSAVVTMIFLPIGGKLMAKYDTRYIIVLGIILQAGAFALFGLMSNVWGWYVLAIPLAMGGVFITVIVGPVVINQWFKSSNVLALGILSEAGGLFGAIEQPIADSLFVYIGWRIAFIDFDLATLV